MELLLQLGAKVNASNNAGDRPWHWANNMGHQEVVALLEQVRGEGGRAGRQLAPHAWRMCSHSNNPEAGLLYLKCGC